MFVLCENDPPFKWPVKLYKPSSKTPGEFEEQTFVALFQPNPALEVEITEPKETSGSTAVRDLDIERMRGVLIGWEDVADQKGDPIPFSEMAREWLISADRVRFALWQAYFEARMTPAIEVRRQGN